MCACALGVVGMNKCAKTGSSTCSLPLPLPAMKRKTLNPIARPCLPLPRLTINNAEPNVLTSFALSLLLVFRTNSCYGRWEEARKIWCAA